MTPLAALAAPDVDALHAAATTGGLRVDAAAGWPETADDTRLAPVAGFIESAFSPLVAHAGERALQRRPAAAGGVTTAVTTAVTAVVLVTAFGDVTSAALVARAVDDGARVSPLMFFQSVPNAVAGYLAARWALRGPVVCVSRVDTGLAIASGLLADGDADEALLVWVEVAASPAAGAPGRAAAVVVSPVDGQP